MTDSEIKQYLDNHNWSVDAQDCVLEVFNTSHQILDKIYDFETSMITIITPDNNFTCNWNLHQYD